VPKEDWRQTLTAKLTQEVRLLVQEQIADAGNKFEDIRDALMGKETI